EVRTAPGTADTRCRLRRQEEAPSGQLCCCPTTLPASSAPLCQISHMRCNQSPRRSAGAITGPEITVQVGLPELVPRGHDSEAPRRSTLVRGRGHPARCSSLTQEEPIVRIEADIEAHITARPLRFLEPRKPGRRGRT